VSHPENHFVECYPQKIVLVESYPQENIKITDLPTKKNVFVLMLPSQKRFGSKLPTENCNF